jgi:hypothetical protein
MLRAQISRARLFDTVERNNHVQIEIDGVQPTQPQEEKPEAGILELTSDDTPMLRQLSIASTSSQTSEPDLLNSPASSPSAEDFVRSVELSLLQDQLKHCQKELTKALQAKDRHLKALALAIQATHSTHAHFLMDKILAPLFWNTIQQEVKLTDEEINAGLVILPTSVDLVREDTFGEFAKKKEEDKPEVFHRPLKIKTANPDTNAKSRKNKILNTLKVKQNIAQQIKDSSKLIEELTLDIQDTETNISREKARIIELQKVSLARNFFTFYSSDIALPPAEDHKEFKRQRRTG